MERVRNIYTFNYDNALEFCLGDKRALSREKAELEGDLEKTKQERGLLQEEYGIFLQEAERTKNGSVGLTSGGFSVGESKSPENHFIIPVILKDYFPNAADDTERVKLFLEYIQPSINNTAKMVKLWKEVDKGSLVPDKSFSMDKDALWQLCELSKTNVFFKPSTAVHYAAVAVEDSSYRYLKDADDDKLRVIIAAARCSLLPVRPSLPAQMKAAMAKSKDSYINEGLGYVARRQKLLYAPHTLTKAEMAEDGYTAILKRLYLYDFPSEKECAFTCETGLDHVRLYSLQRMLYGSTKVDLKQENIVSLFANPQELTLVNDWMNWLERDYESPIREAAKKFRKNYNTYHLSEYVEAYLREMREKKEPDAYGNVTETIYLDGRPSGYENAAVLLNSLIELGVTFAGHTVLTDNDWVDLVQELMPYHPYPLVFYTIARGS